MNETANQENTATEQERTFTQAEMDAIIGERLRRESYGLLSKWYIHDKAVENIFGSFFFC